MKVYFAADHAGFDLKNVLLNFVRGELGHDVEDCGAFEKDPSDDYPAIIAAAAQKLALDVRNGHDSRAILLGGSGQGEAMAANRFKGVRAAVYYGDPARRQIDATGVELDMIISTREHNDANALSLGARFLTEDDAKRTVERWIGASFGRDERHVRRIKKLDMLGE